mmetsp:Transcript_6376/g.9020  ORF Transcript_6376/g.9020 Transcript_6376/m.9020 type:complete len:555 (+) Transcript_6376:109-1773(+)
MACVRQQPYPQQHFSNPSGTTASTKRKSKSSDNLVCHENLTGSKPSNIMIAPTPSMTVSSEQINVTSTTNAMPPPPSRLSSSTMTTTAAAASGATGTTAQPTMLTAEHRVVSTDESLPVDSHIPSSPAPSYKKSHAKNNKRKANSMSVNTSSSASENPVMAMKSPISTCLSLILGAAETIAKRDEAKASQSANSSKTTSTGTTKATAVKEEPEQPATASHANPPRNTTKMHFSDYRHVKIPSPSFDEEPSYQPPPYHYQNNHHHPHHPPPPPPTHHSFHHHNSMHQSMHHRHHHHQQQQHHHHHSLHPYNATAPASAVNSRTPNSFYRPSEMHTYTAAIDRDIKKSVSNDPIEVQLEDPTVYKNLILTMALQRPKAKETKGGDANATHQQQQILAPPSKVIGEGFYWKEYPPLENLLYSHMGEYYEWSTRSRQSKHQQAFNNALVEKVRSIAAAEGFSFDPSHFTDKRLRDRIRCFFKTHLQNAKKRLNTLKKNVNSKDNRASLQDLLQQARQVEAKAQTVQPLVRTVSISSEEEAVAVGACGAPRHYKKRRKS